MKIYLNFNIQRIKIYKHKIYKEMHFRNGEKIYNKIINKNMNNKYNRIRKQMNRI